MSPFDNLILTAIVLDIIFCSLGIAYITLKMKASLAAGVIKIIKLVKQ